MQAEGRCKRELIQNDIRNDMKYVEDSQTRRETVHIRESAGESGEHEVYSSLQMKTMISIIFP